MWEQDPNQLDPPISGNFKEIRSQRSDFNHSNGGTENRSNSSAGGNSLRVHGGQNGLQPMLSLKSALDIPEEMFGNASFLCKATIKI
eukprot:12402579-Karenia_brevis.AAC.1